MAAELGSDPRPEEMLHLRSSGSETRSPNAKSKIREEGGTPTGGEASCCYAALRALAGRRRQKPKYTNTDDQTIGSNVSHDALVLETTAALKTETRFLKIDDVTPQNNWNQGWATGGQESNYATEAQCLDRVAKERELLTEAGSNESQEKHSVITEVGSNESQEKHSVITGAGPQGSQAVNGIISEVGSCGSQEMIANTTKGGPSGAKQKNDLIEEGSPESQSMSKRFRVPSTADINEEHGLLNSPGPSEGQAANLHDHVLKASRHQEVNAALADEARAGGGEANEHVKDEARGEGTGGGGKGVGVMILTLRVKLPTGKSVLMGYDPESPETAADLKERICDTIRLRAERSGEARLTTDDFYLSFGHRPLRNEEELNKLGLKDGSFIEGNGALRGGGVPIVFSAASFAIGREQELSDEFNLLFGNLDAVLAKLEVATATLEDTMSNFNKKTDILQEHVANLHQRIDHTASDTSVLASAADAAVHRIEAETARTRMETENALRVVYNSLEADLSRVLAAGLQGYQELRRNQEAAAAAAAPRVEEVIGGGAPLQQPLLPPPPPPPVPSQPVLQACGAPFGVGAASNFLQQQQQEQQQQQPHQQQHQQQQAVHGAIPDPWCQARQPPQQQQQQQASPGTASTAGAGHGPAWLPQSNLNSSMAPSSSFKLDHRRWDKKVDPQLDLSSPSSYPTWHLRAERWLNGGHASVDRLLRLVRLEKEELTHQRETQLMAEAGVPFDLEELNRALADGICDISSAEVGRLSSALGSSRGLELYRYLHVRARGTSRELVQEWVHRLLRPTRCATLLSMKDSLVTMRELMRDVELQRGSDLSEEEKLMALKGLIPLRDLDVIQDMELVGTVRGFTAILAFIEQKVAQAHLRHLSESSRAKQGLNALGGDGSQQGGPPGVAPGSASWEWPAGGAGGGQGDEGDDVGAAMAQMELALNALAKAKGKGRPGGRKGAPGAGRKGPPKAGGGGGGKGLGKDGGKNGKGIPRNFAEGCWHCGGQHRRSDCPAFTKVMTDLRAKGLREVAEKTEEHGAAIDDQTWYLAQFEGWDVEGGSVNVIVRDFNAAVTRLRKSAARRPLVDAFSGACSPGCACSNPFEALDDETDEDTKSDQTKKENESEIAIAGSKSEIADTDADSLGENLKKEEDEAGAPARLPHSIPNGFFGYMKPTGEESGWTEVKKMTAKKEKQQKKKADLYTRRRLSLDFLSREGAASSSNPLVAPVTADDQSYVVVRALVDSGAEDTVAPPGAFPGETVPSMMSRAGLKYRAANGSPIENMGQVMALFDDSSGRRCGLPFQVAAVERPLVSVTRLTEAGHSVTFTKDGGEIHHLSSGRRIPLLREKGVYILEMNVPKIPAAAGADAGFPRQVKR